VDAAGNPVWTANGVELRGTGVSLSAGNPQITADGSGGAIVTWLDYRSGQSDVYAQRVDASGNPVWTANGVELRGTGVSGDAVASQVTSDGSGGAIVTWADHRSGNSGIYAQRVDAAGNPLWTANGVALRGTGVSLSAGNPQITADGSGGAIITWPDYRSGSQWEIYAQRVDSAGNPLWTANGVALRGTGVPNSAYTNRMTQDGSGGAIVTWLDYRSGQSDVYAQRVNAAGNPIWTANGVLLKGTGVNETETAINITSDGSGGAIATWVDYRSGIQNDVYAQKVDASGSPVWTANGVELRGTSVSNEARHPCISPDGSGGAIVAWFDYRSGSQWEIYAQRVSDSAPYIASTYPDAGAQGQTDLDVAITGTGTNFQNGVSAATFSGMGITVNSTTVISPTEAVANLDIDAGATLGPRDVNVVTGNETPDPLVGGFAVTTTTWYLAEGATSGGMEEWVLVENPNPLPVQIDMAFDTGGGELVLPELQGVYIPAESRSTFNLASYTTNSDISTRVTVSGGEIICERAMYEAGRQWGTDSVGTTTASDTWYLAEGSTAGGMETFILIQNPGTEPAEVSVDFLTDEEVVEGPRDLIPAHTRRTYKANDWTTSYDVSTRVTSNKKIVCERAMYSGDQTWAHDSIGATAPALVWYLAEGSTDGGMETYILVQNPNPGPVTVDLALMTGEGEGKPPELQGQILAGNSRRSFPLHDYVTTYDVSTRVTSSGGEIICERSMYGPARAWATCSVGATAPAPVWYLAEGCTEGGMETYILVQNPNEDPVSVDITFIRGSGEVDGPQDMYIPGKTRATVLANQFLTDFNVSTVVNSTGEGVICERAMYSSGRVWAHDSIGYAP
jgi:P pilus assembly chaperone PapD